MGVEKIKDKGVDVMKNINVYDLLKVDYKNFMTTLRFFQWIVSNIKIFYHLYSRKNELLGVKNENSSNLC